RMEHLQADMQLRPKMYLGSQDVASQMDQANELSKAELNNLESKAEAYERAHLDSREPLLILNFEMRCLDVELDALMLNFVWTDLLDDSEWFLEGVSLQLNVTAKC
ncbi:unnamed protein product, partial [Durusdinium trenchii]